MFWLVFRFFSCSGLFQSVIFKLAIVMSLNTLKKSTKEELTNMALEYQNKFHNMLGNINTELSSLKDRFTKIEFHLLATRRMNDNLLKQNRILKKNVL